MEEYKYKDSTVRLGTEEWTVKYMPQVIHRGKHCKAARVPSRKEIWLSICDENGNRYSNDSIVSYFEKAIAPIVVEQAKLKYGEGAVKDSFIKEGITYPQ